MDLERFGTFVAVDQVEADHFSFAKRFEAISHDASVMDEHILSGILRDEAKTLLVVEPLYFSAGHNESSHRLGIGTPVQVARVGTNQSSDMLYQPNACLITRIGEKLIRRKMPVKPLFGKYCPIPSTASLGIS